MRRSDWLFFVALALVLVLVAVAYCYGAEDRKYHKVTIQQMASGKVLHTHVEVTGTVTLVKKEGDRDIHIRLSDGSAFIVAECIPTAPCIRPKKGQTVTVRGIVREDRKHKWWEVHPVEALEVK